MNLNIFLLLVLMSCALARRERRNSYEIRDGKIGDLKTKVLFNAKTREYAVIIVDYGGRVEELALLPRSVGGRRGRVLPQQILLSHNGDVDAIKENVWWKGMFLIPWANRIAYGRYTFYNSTYQLPLNENSSTRKNSMHGLLANKMLTVEDANANKNEAVLTLSYDFKKEEEPEGYPFDWLFQITYTLSPQGLDISIAVGNIMPSSPLPLYIGWHPYFLCTSHKAVITFDKCTGWNHVEMNSNANPTGITSWGVPFDGNTPIGGNATNPTAYDDEYKATMPPSASGCNTIQTKLYDPDTGKTVVLYQSAEMRFLQVFTGVLGAIAIEPMSGMADAFNNHDHLSVVSGREVWEASFGVYLE